MALQFSYFLVIARTLGDEKYGIFATITSLVAIFAPFSTLGSGNILIQNVSLDKQRFSKYWIAALKTTFASSMILFVIIFISGLVLFAETNILLLGFVVISDVMFYRINDLSGQAFQAYGKLKYTSILQVLPNLCRFIGLLVFLAFGTDENLITWSIYYMLFTFIAALLSLMLVWKKIGWSNEYLRIDKNYLVDGIHYSIGLSTQSIYNDADKIILSKLSGASATGNYAASYRVIDAAFTPIRSILFASYARFFQAGAHGIGGAISFSKKIFPFFIFYSFFSIASINLISPYIAKVFGDGFEQMSELIIMLSPLIIFKSLGFFAADILTGAGHQRLRSRIQIFIAVFNLTLSIFLISRYGVLGAVISSLITDAVLFITMFAAVYFVWRDQNVGIIDKRC